MGAVAVRRPTSAPIKGSLDATAPTPGRAASFCRGGLVVKRSKLLDRIQEIHGHRPFQRDREVRLRRASPLQKYSDASFARSGRLSVTSRSRLKSFAALSLSKSTPEIWWGKVYLICLVFLACRRLRERLRLRSHAVRIQRWYRRAVRQADYGAALEETLRREDRAISTFILRHGAVPRRSYTNILRVYLQHCRAASKIQRQYRRYAERREMMHLLHLTIPVARLQQWYRRCLLVRTFRLHASWIAAGNDIGRWFTAVRRRRERRRDRRRWRSAIRIQRFYRICRAKEELSSLAEQRYAAMGPATKGVQRCLRLRTPAPPRCSSRTRRSG